MKIAILGAGAFGTALGGILAEKGWDIDYYDSKLERERLSSVTAGAKYIVLAVPSNAVGYLVPHLPADIPLIVATKGVLLDDTFSRIRDVMVLSGPGFADDIKAHKPVTFTVTDARVKELFATDYVRCEMTQDNRGVLMCGALKNVYAIEAGMRKLQRGSAPWREYIEKAAGEMKAVLSVNGANPETVELSCGRGDLELTCGLPSRNYEYGLRLAEDAGVAPDKTVEGISTLARLRRGEIKIPADAEILRGLIVKSAKWRQNGTK